MATRPLHRIASLLLVCALIQSGTAWAAPQSEATLSAAPLSLVPESVPVTPRRPIAPSLIPQPKVKNVFRCERKFVYLGKVFDCDSNVERDAERLRPLMTDVPGALEDLDNYQRTRQTVRNAAYAGSLGLLAVISGELLSRTFTDANGNLTSTGTQLRNYTAFGGAGLALISFFIGWFTLQRNEKYWDSAVQLHNQAHPDTPIQILHF